MRLAENLKGTSRLVMLLLLIIFFLLGATVSYVWTMGFYAPNEYSLPSKTNITIEDVRFPIDVATYFNVTVLNPSYSQSDARIEQIKVVTGDNLIHLASATLPALPFFPLAPGRSQTFKCFWDWGNYTGQTVEVDALVADGSGSAVQVKTTFVNLTITDVIFEPSVTVTSFKVTVASMGSPVGVDINWISVNEVVVANVTPTLPYALSPNASVTFTLGQDWTDLQDKTATIQVQTKQGYIGYKSVTAPQVILNISDNIVFFNTTATDFYFNVTIQNSAVSSAKIDINGITVHVEGTDFAIGTVDPPFTQQLEPNSNVTLTCKWNWNDYQGKKFTVTVYTVQGFKATSTEVTIPSVP